MRIYEHVFSRDSSMAYITWILDDGSAGDGISGRGFSDLECRKPKTWDEFQAGVRRFARSYAPRRCVAAVIMYSEDRRIHV